MANRIQIRGDTAANWTSSNPTLAAREIGIETDTLKMKVGDGVTIWASLPYHDQLVTTNRQAASYTLVLPDRGKLVEMNVAIANNLTVPPNSSVAFAIGTQILITQYAAGQTTVVAGTGVTIRSVTGALSLAGQYSAATLLKIGTDEWYLFGDII